MRVYRIRSNRWCRYYTWGCNTKCKFRWTKQQDSVNSIRAKRWNLSNCPNWKLWIHFEEPEGLSSTLAPQPGNLAFLNDLTLPDHAEESLSTYIILSVVIDCCHLPSHRPWKRIPLFYSSANKACCYSFPEQTFSEPTARSILVRLGSPRTTRAKSCELRTEGAAAFVPLGKASKIKGKK